MNSDLTRHIASWAGRKGTMGAKATSQISLSLGCSSASMTRCWRCRTLCSMLPALVQEELQRLQRQKWSKMHWGLLAKRQRFQELKPLGLPSLPLLPSKQLTKQLPLQKQPLKQQPLRPPVSSAWKLGVARCTCSAVGTRCACGTAHKCKNAHTTEKIYPISTSSTKHNEPPNKPKKCSK